MIAAALLCGAAMVSCTEKLEEMPEAKSTVASPDNPSTTPDNQTYGEWYYVPLEELLTGEWVMATDSSALTDPVRTTELLMSLGFTAPLSFSEAFVVPELPWQGLLMTIPEFDTNYYGRYVRMTFENGVMHVDRAEYRNTYGDNHNIIRIDTVPIPTRTDFTFEQENDCRIHFTPINPDGWWHGHSNTQAYDNRLIICSLNRDRFVVFNDMWFCTLGNERNVTLFRRVR